MMKVFVMFLLCAGLCIGSEAQVSLTKGETIDYLNKKIKESIGHKFSNNNGYIGEIADAEVKADAKGIVIQYKWLNTNSKYYSVIYTFNPAHITGVSQYDNTTTSPVNEMWMSLIGKTCVYKSGEPYYGFSNSGESKSVEYANLLFVRGDPANFEKIKKALLYLRDLLKAEDDPFK